MRFNYNGHSEMGGIYKLTNTLNGRVYIGSCKRFGTRWPEHCRALRNGTHSNKFLLHDYRKCTEEAFVFEVLEIMQSDRELRLLREEEYLRIHYDNQQNCYNLTNRAISREGIKDRSPEASFQRRSAAGKGRKHSPESIQLMSEVQKATPNRRNTGRKHSDEAKVKISTVHKGRKFTEEHKMKLSIAAKNRRKKPSM